MENYKVTIEGPDIPGVDLAEGEGCIVFTNKGDSVHRIVAGMWSPAAVALALVSTVGSIPFTDEVHRELLALLHRIKDNGGHKDD